MGACRDCQVRTPPAFSPQDCCETTAARTGGGVLFSHSWGGVTGRGLPRRRGHVSGTLRQKKLSPSQIIRDSGSDVPSIFEPVQTPPACAIPNWSKPIALMRVPVVPYSGSRRVGNELPRRVVNGNRRRERRIIVRIRHANTVLMSPTYAIAFHVTPWGRFGFRRGFLGYEGVVVGDVRTGGFRDLGVKKAISYCEPAGRLGRTMLPRAASGAARANNAATIRFCNFTTTLRPFQGF